MSGNGHTPTITGWQECREVLVRHSEDQPCPLVDDWVWGRTGGTVEVIVPGPRDDSVIADIYQAPGPSVVKCPAKAIYDTSQYLGDVSEVLHKVPQLEFSLKGSFEVLNLVLLLLSSLILLKLP